MAVLSDAGLRRSEASSLTWGDVQRWEDGSGRITVFRSKTDAEAIGAVVAVTPAAMKALGALRPAGASGDEKVFGLSESQIARRVKVIAKAAGLADWEFFSGHSGRVGMASRMAQNGASTHEIARQGRWKQGGGMVGRYTRGETVGLALRYLRTRQTPDTKSVNDQFDDGWTTGVSSSDSDREVAWPIALAAEPSLDIN